LIECGSGLVGRILSAMGIRCYWRGHPASRYTARWGCAYSENLKCEQYIATKDRLRRCSWAVLIGLLLAILLSSTLPIHNASSSFVRGDFPAFYAAATIVASGQGRDLYDSDLQREIEHKSWPTMDGESEELLAKLASSRERRDLSLRQGSGSKKPQAYLLEYVEDFLDPADAGPGQRSTFAVEDNFASSSKYLFYSYPAFYAVILSPLAHLPPQVAKNLFTLLMVLCLWLSVVTLSRRVCSWASVYRLELFTYLCVLPSNLLAVWAGQNVAISLLCFSLTLTAVSSKSKKGDLLAGMCIGLWSFKPHYALGCLLCLLACGRIRAGAGFLFIAIILYCLGATFCGLDWPYVWVMATYNFAKLDSAANAFQMISLPDMGQSISAAFGIDGFAKKIVLGVFNLTAIGLLLYYLLRLRRDSRLNRSCLPLLSLAPAVVLVVVPHVLAYDVGLVVLSGICFLHVGRDRAVFLLLLAAVIVGVGILFREQLIINPLGLITFAFVVWALRKTRLA